MRRTEPPDAAHRRPHRAPAPPASRTCQGRRRILGTTATRVDGW
ncbi:hypothetical protein ACR6C2_18045 [Streptomyces sp. INA 01156]